MFQEFLQQSMELPIILNGMENIKKYILLISIITIAIMVGTFRNKIREAYYLILFKSEKYTNPSYSRALNYRFYKPKLKQDLEIPLLINLHPGNHKGTDNKIQVNYLVTHWAKRDSQKEFPCYIIAPQCPHDVEWVTIRPKSIPYGHYEQDKHPEGEEMKMLFELIAKTISDYPIDTSRIYITGHSMGATGSWDMMLRYPDLFAAALISSGETDTSKANLLTHIPIWAFAGEKDNIVTASVTTKMAEAINQAGGNVQLTVFQNKGHDIGHLAIKDINSKKWLFSQIKKCNHQ